MVVDDKKQQQQLQKQLQLKEKGSERLWEMQRAVGPIWFDFDQQIVFNFHGNSYLFNVFFRY